MTPLLADLSPAELSLGIALLAAIVGAYLKFNTVEKTIFERNEMYRTAKEADKKAAQLPQPLAVAVSSSPTFADREATNARFSSIDTKIAHLEGSLAALRVENQLQTKDLTHLVTERTDKLREEIGGTHDRINDVLKAVSELRGEIKHL